ncbi:MAG: hypothetical protein ABGZ31_09780, partial [Roseibacillus sp.]
MTSPKNKYYLGIAVIVALALGFWLVRDIVATVKGKQNAADSGGPRPHIQFDRPNVPSKAPWRHNSRKAPGIDEILFGLPGERIVRFKNEEGYRDFLTRVGETKLRVLGRL